MPSACSQIAQVIQNNYEGLSVILNTNVSYVNLLQGRRDARNTFVCIQRDRLPIKPLRKGVKSPKAPVIKEEAEEDLDLTGSPLKDDFHMEVVNMSLETTGDHYKTWTEAEECYSGVSVDIARAVISDLGELEDEEPQAVPKMWILCNGLDTEKTLLLENEMTSEWWTRGVVQLRESVPIDTVTMDQLMPIHLKSFPELKIFDTEIESTYYLQENTHVRVEMSFQRLLPSFTFFQGAQVTLKQFLDQDGTSPIAACFWNDIITLNYIKKYILDYARAGHKVDPTYECGSGMRLRDVKEEIARIFSTIVFGTDLNDQEEEAEGLRTKGLEEIVANATSRDYTDITDSLWNLLKCCASYQDLRVAFNYMFHLVQMNNVVNVPSNKNHVATLIREIAHGRLTNLCLSGTEPLELLLEIGLEKVEKDYEFIFVRSKITTAKELEAASEFHKENVSVKRDGMVRKSVFHSAKNNQMSKATTARTTLLLQKRGPKVEEDEDEDEKGFHYSDFDENEAEMQLCKLAHYHGILEHLLHLNKSFNNVDVFALVMEHMLQQPMHFPFRVVKERGFKDLEMSVVHNSLLKRVKDSFPNIRRVTFVTKKSSLEVKTTFVHSMDPIFPVAPVNETDGDVEKAAVMEKADGEEVIDEKAVLSPHLYHQYFYRSVSSKW